MSAAALFDCIDEPEIGRQANKRQASAEHGLVARSNGRWGPFRSKDQQGPEENAAESRHFLVVQALDGRHRGLP